MRMRSRKRSSWDSGSACVPSYSSGFWVASTMNGRGSERGLAPPGHVLDQQMTAGQQPDHRQPDRLGLPYQRARDVVLEAADASEGHPFDDTSDSGRIGSAVMRTPRGRTASATALA